MIGLLLLAIALVTFCFDRTRYLSYFLYISFMTGYYYGLGIWTDVVTGVKNIDCAVAYTFLVNLYFLYRRQWTLPQLPFVKYLVAFLMFLLCSIGYSHFHYGLSFYQILQGSRHYLVLFSLPIFWQCRRREFVKILRLLFYICIVCSLLYIPQVFLGINLLPYDGEGVVDKFTGLYRFHNVPANLDLFLCLSFVVPHLFAWKNTTLLRLLFLAVLFCNLGRSLIICTLAMLILTVLIRSHAGRLVQRLFLLLLVAAPLVYFVLPRFSEGGTQEDLETILSGDFGDTYQSQQDATMTYRLAWCFERFAYLSGRPVGEQFFGMGLCSDSQDWVSQNYDFRIGLTDEETNSIVQLSTPDIAYGNLICRLGFGGSLFYLAFVFSMIAFFWKHRKVNSIFAFYAAFFILMLPLGFSGSTFSNPQYFCMPFLVCSLLHVRHRRHKPLRTAAQPLRTVTQPSQIAS